MMDDLLQLARRMMLRAHAPYSGFHVGAALRAEDGSIHGGCNVENAAYPQGLCAEAGAIAALVAGGHKRIVEALVVGPGPEVITPCGGCRQKLREFAADDVPVHLCGPDGLHRTVTLGQLLPLSFGPNHLADSGAQP
jgi:cytidine deaminase